MPIDLGSFEDEARAVAIKTVSEWSKRGFMLIGAEHSKLVMVSDIIELVRSAYVAGRDERKATTGNPLIDAALTDPANPIKTRSQCCAHVPGHKCACICNSKVSP